MFKKIISSILVFAIIFSSFVVPSFADETILLPDLSAMGIATTTVLDVVTGFGLGSKLGVDMNAVSFNVMKERIIQDMDKVKQLDRTVLNGKYPTSKSVFEAAYRYAQNNTSLGDYFRSTNAYDYFLGTYYRVPASSIQTLSDSMKLSSGAYLKGYYSSQVDGYIYRVISTPIHVTSRFDYEPFTFAESVRAGLNMFLMNNSIEYGAYEWDVSAIFNRFVSLVDGNHPYSSNRWLTGPDGGIIVGIQDSSAATTENNYYETTNKTEVSVDQDNQFNVNINDVGNTTNTSVLDFEKLEYWDIENLTYSPIDNLVYNAGDKSYTVNNIYNISFTYNYTYYIQIGASEEYVGAYEVYFELPDGRNSKDLTADEIYGLSTDAGFINFDVANENPDLLGLWPMDGNLSNSAVSGLEMSFTSGASSTYLETDNFGGSLYVPYVNGSKLGVSGSSSSADSFTVTNSAGHAFTIDLSDDFPYNPLEPVTFQWRQYINGQLSTPTIENTKYKYRYTHYLSFARCMFPSFSISGSADSSVLTNPAYSSTSEGDGDFSFHYSSSTNSAIGGFDFTATTSSSFVTSSSFATYGVWNDYCLVVEPGTPYLEQANRGNYNRDYLIFPFSYSVWVNGIRVLSVSSMARLLIQYSSSSLDKISTLGNFYSGYPVPSWLIDDNCGDFGGYQLDNIRILSGALYSVDMENIPVAGQPFDSNKVLVLPEDTSGLKTPTIAVYSDIPITDTRIGGVRQSIPKTGYVYCHVDNNRIDSIQIYDGSGWLEVGGMIWTGSRWVPPDSYDVVRYVDLFDVVTDSDTTVTDAVTESNSLLGSILLVLTDFRDGVFAFFDSGGSGSPGDDTDIEINQDNDIVVLPDSNPDDEEDDSVSLWDLLKIGVKSGIKLLGSLWTSGISDSIDGLDGGLDGVSGFGDADISVPGQVDTSPPETASDTDEIDGIGVINIWGY